MYFAVRIHEFWIVIGLRILVVAKIIFFALLLVSSC